MKFIFRKVVEAKSIADALKKEKKVKPLEVYMSEDEFKQYSVTEKKVKVGFKEK
jgi:hypothetical protein